MTTFRGPPLSTENDLGPNTLGLFLRDAAARHGPREAIVFYDGDERISWSYADLDEHASDVARSLLAAAGSVRVRREKPVANSRGKLPPFKTVAHR